MGKRDQFDRPGILAHPAEPHGGRPGVWGWTLASTWALSVAAYGWTQGLDVRSFEVAGPLCAVGVAPSLLFLFASAALSEARRARQEARRLFLLASRAAAAPIQAANMQAREMGGALREEIGSLHGLVASAIDHLATLEASVGQSVGSLEAVVGHAREGADVIANVLKNERAAFEGLTLELRAECDELGGDVARQVRMLRDAARLFRSEQASAEELLEAKAAALSDAAQTLAERSKAIGASADEAVLAAQRFDESMTEAKETLRIAAAVQDHSRGAVEQAAETAHNVVAAMHEAAERALDDARRTGELLRAEAAEAEQSAAASIARLRVAAENTREQDFFAKPVRAAAATAADPMERLRAANGGSVIFEPTAAVGAMRAGGRRPAPVREAPRRQQPAAAPSPLAERAVAILEEAGIRASNGFAPEDIQFILDRSKDGPVARRRATQAAFPDLVDQLADYLSQNADALTEAAQYRSRAETEPLRAHIPAAASYLLIEAAIG